MAENSANNYPPTLKNNPLPCIHWQSIGNPLVPFQWPFDLKVAHASCPPHSPHSSIILAYHELDRENRLAEPTFNHVPRARIHTYTHTVYVYAHTVYMYIKICEAALFKTRCKTLFVTIKIQKMEKSTPPKRKIKHMCIAISTLKFRPKPTWAAAIFASTLSRLA